MSNRNRKHFKAQKNKPTVTATYLWQRRFWLIMVYSENMEVMRIEHLYVSAFDWSGEKFQGKVEIKLK